MIGQEEEKRPLEPDNGILDNLRMDDPIPDGLWEDEPERGDAEIPPLSPEELEEIVAGAGLLVTCEDMERALEQDGIPLTAPLRAYLREIGAVPPLTPEEEGELTARAAEGDEDSKSRLIEGSLRLVLSVARRYADTGVPLNDLIQEGSLGLMSAVENYDRTKGHRFSAYALWWIRRAVLRAAADRSRDERLSVRTVERISRVTRSRLALKRAYGREPSMEEIAADTGMTVDAVTEAVYIAMDVGSPAPARDVPARETVEKKTSPEQDAEARERRKFEMIRKMVADALRYASLTAREEKLIRMRFGLDDGRPHTLEEVAAAFGITKERVRLIEAKLRRKT